MEGWPRIPNQNNASSSRPKSGIPAPGTVVMASVEEELGDGVYSLRWGGNRISVSSRSPLKTGQSLILKAETNAEGKPTLVVQGPALPEPGSITGRVIYGPAKNRAHSKGQNAADPAAMREPGSGGNQIAAGTSRANVIQAPTPVKPVQDLIGAVLEPLPDLEASVELLEEAVEKEKERLEEKREKEQKKAEAEKRGEQPQDGDEAVDENAAVHDRRARPAGRHGAHAPPGGSAAAPVPGDGSGAPPAEAARPPILDQFGRPAAPPPPRPGVVPQPLAGETPAPPRLEQPLPQTPASNPPGQSPSQSVPAPVPPAPGAPAIVLPETAGPSVPEPAPLPPPLPQHGAAQGSPPSQQPPPPPQPSPQSAPAVQAPAPDVPVIVMPDGTVPQPSGNPAQPAPAAQSQPPPATVAVMPEGTGPVVPDAPVKITPDGPAVPPQATVSPPAAAGGGQPPVASVAAVPEGMGPAVPDAPPQTRPPSHSVPVSTLPGPAAPSQPQPAVTDGTPQTAQPVPPDRPRDVPPAVDTRVTPEPPRTQPQARPVAVTPGGPVPVVPDAPLPAMAQGGAGKPPSPQPITPQPLPAAPSAPSRVEAPIPVIVPDEAGPVVPDAPPAARPSPPPRPENGQSSRQPQQYGPPRSDTGTIRERQAALPSGEMVDMDASAEARAAVKPEAVLKEALTQMVKAAELPLAGRADVPPLSLAAKPPPETLDKAAELLLQAAGVTPDKEAVAAARALIKQNVAIDRDNVQTVLTAAAEFPEPEREAAMNAAARLLSKDIPVSPPLVAGLVDVLDRRAGTHELIEQTKAALAIDPGDPGAEQLMKAAGELLDMLHVDLDSPGAPEAIERYLTTFGRETLGKALALVETAAQAVLEGNPELQRLDGAIAAVVTELGGELAQAQVQELAEEGLPSPSTGLPPPREPEPQPVQVTPPPARPVPSAPINAYLNAPRAFDIAEALKNLPPMPQLVSINSPVPQEAVPVAPLPLPAPLPDGAVPIPMPDVTLPQPPAGALPPQVPSQPGTPQPAPTPTPAPAPMPLPGEGFLMPKLDSLFQIPGLNRPEMELLKPSGFMERFLQSADGGPDEQHVKEDARALLRQLTSEDARQVERGLREMKNKSAAVLRETAARLNEREVEVMRTNTVLNRLADAATSLRDLGRQLLAVKAENLAGQDREPGVMLAEVPFKLNDDAGEGRMQMFYRRRKDKGEGWNNRVILDLNTTRMGPVLGDMRFFGQDMVLNMFVERGETAAYLEASGQELVAALADKGFRVKARFMVLPPRSAPEIRAERPVISGEEELGAGPGGDHKLDIKG